MEGLEPQISDELMGFAMEFRVHAVDQVKKLRANVFVPQLRAGAGHHRTFSIVPGGRKTVTVHNPVTRKRSYEYFVVSVAELHETPPTIKRQHEERPHAERFTGDTTIDPFRGKFSLGALYEVATAIRRGGNIPEEVSMEFEANWKGDQLKRILVYLEYPESSDHAVSPEELGRRLESLSAKDATSISHTCLEKMRGMAEEKYRLSPSQLETYVALDETGARVYGIGVRRWLD